MAIEVAPPADNGTGTPQAMDANVSVQTDANIGGVVTINTTPGLDTERVPSLSPSGDFIQVDTNETLSFSDAKSELTSTLTELGVDSEGVNKINTVLEGIHNRTSEAKAFLAQVHENAQSQAIQNDKNDTEEDSIPEWLLDQINTLTSSLGQITGKQWSQMAAVTLASTVLLAGGKKVFDGILEGRGGGGMAWSGSKAKLMALMGIIVGLTTACGGAEATQVPTPTNVITLGEVVEGVHPGLDNAWSTVPWGLNGTELYVQNEQQLLAKDLRGYTTDGNGDTVETAGSFALYFANLETKDGNLATQKVTILKETLADGGAGLELMLLQDQANEEDVSFSLIDKNGKDTGFKMLFVNDNTVILRLTGKFDGENVTTVDYVLANDQVSPTEVPTVVPTESPDMLIQLFTKIIELDPGLESAAAAPQSTETPDPLAGAPEGFTSFDQSMGMWSRIDAESGKTIYWDAERNAEYSLMFNDDLWDRRPDLESQLPDSLRLKVFIDPRLENWNKLTVTHEENMSKQGEIDWTVFFQNTLWTKMMFAGLITDELDFSNELFYNGVGYTKNYNTNDGPQKLTLKAGNISSVYIRSDYEALLADSENNGFTQANGGDLGGVAIKYMIRITSDADGNTTTEIAPSISDISSIPDARHIEMYLFGFSNALCNPDDPVVPRATSLSTELAKNHSVYQYFVFTRSE